MFRRLSMLLVLAVSGLAACSSSGSPVTAPASSKTPATISVALGSATNLGGVETFLLAVTAYNASGQVITGQYTEPVTLTTSDTTDTGFAPDYQASAISSSVTLASSTQSVFFVYDGASVGAVNLMATTASASATAVFEATGLATATPAPGTATTAPTATPTPNATPSPYINLLYVSTAGAPPFPPTASATGPGSQPIYISARDQNGNEINGTYPSTVSVTINNASQLDLSLGSYVAAVDCTGDSTCANVAAQTVTASDTTVFGNYTTNFTTAQVSVSTISVDTAGNKETIECSAINFPLQNGSMPYTCQPLNPAPSAVHRDTRRVKTNLSAAAYFSKN